MSNNKFNFGQYIKDTILTKTYGCFVGLGAVLLTLIQLIAYCFVPTATFNGAVIAFCVVGIVMFLALSLFRHTSPFAPIVLMMFDFACIVGLAQANGIVDYLSTLFFAGVDLSLLPPALLISIIMFILSFITASVAMYLPQNKKIKQSAAQEQQAQATQTEEA